jgi:tRNA (guanine37-N1)-methyltransferase
LITDYKVITLFPELISTWKECGVVYQGLKKGLFQISEIDLRDFGIGNYKQVDDAPYGGGPGMVLMPEPLDKAITSSKADINVFLTPSGQQLNENLISELLEYKSINLVCGRYEGFDQRILEIHSDYEISIGQSVVSGGEVPALYLLEALIRKIPDVLGNPDSLKSETFTDNKIDYPVYTRPEVFKKKKVPEVLLSGNHQKIDEWKKNNLKDI